MFNCGDRTRTGVCNVVWPLTKKRILNLVSMFILFNMRKTFLIIVSIYVLITYQCCFIFSLLWSNFYLNLELSTIFTPFCSLSPWFRRNPQSKCELNSISCRKKPHLLQLSLLSYFKLLVVETSTWLVNTDLLQDNKFYNSNRRTNFIISFH